MKILAFDPGTRFMGWALLECSPPKEKVKVLKYGTFVGSKYLKLYSKDTRNSFTDNFLILHAYRDAVKTCILDAAPDAIVSEGVFVFRHVAAAFSLVRCVHVLREASFVTYKKNVNIVAPKLTKRTLTGNHNASKEEIKEAVDKHKFIITPKDKSDFTEHVYDAIGHGYHYIQTLLHPDKFYLLKPKKVKPKK